MAFELRLSARLFQDGQKCFGPGVTELLDGVEREGSLRAAAEGMGMAYSKAWTTLRSCEEALGHPLLTRKTGGRSGGSSHLTHEGRTLLAGYHRMEETLRRTGDALLEEFDRTWSAAIEGEEYHERAD